jgi:hypothetical protein
LQYEFGKQQEKQCNCTSLDKPYQNKVGAQLYTVFKTKKPQAAITAFYYRRLFNSLHLKTTYTIDSYSHKNLGVGISAHISSFNFYAMLNNLLEFKNIAKAQSVSLQLGFNIILD